LAGGKYSVRRYGDEVERVTTVAKLAKLECCCIIEAKTDLLRSVSLMPYLEEIIVGEKLSRVSKTADSERGMNIRVEIGSGQVIHRRMKI
jgi:hypothetical protein